MANYLVIGLGRFGRSVAKTLYGSNQDVLALDIDEELVQQAIDEKIVDEAIVVDSSDEIALKNIVKDNFDTAFVCIGDNIQASILTTLILKEAGVSKIICKAQNRQHGKVLEKIGATQVVYPEEFMGERVASKVLRPSIMEHFKFSEDYSIIEIEAPKKFDGKNLIELDLRNRYEANVIGIKRKDGKLIVSPKPLVEIEAGDLLVIIADTRKIDLLSKIL